ncbi:class I SAM-dependent methyltransferase [Pseudobacteroides cellulosolvens]|uniref:Methyltransferase type 11 n=1 Tax=Pseudobacteroides cellulosolvens ATCC 35603 = DSM 2933 TaxID=398512 RepID=A0A0L6JKT6_9FIRM|nr:class I SAM-dependent methyltransferase [Pseudobacteroides cellulosolvens]KNY26404.1 Methyltransferase type 11 [Pseudobacteroides cellulosolvens ATCC 35603 = DSM 2933]
MDYKTEQSRSNYNRKAREYENTFDGKFTAPFKQYIYDHINVKDNDNVLDVACGNGRLLNMISKKGRIHGFGIDVSEEMIKTAQKDNNDIVFKVCEANKTPFDDKIFDIITVCCAFHHFVDPEAFMKEAYRILKHGGRLIIADPTAPVIIRQIENVFIPLFKMGDVRIYNKKEMIRFFKNAQFKEIKYYQEGARMVVEGVRG